MSYSSSASLSDRDQYPTGFFVSSGCAWSSTLPTWKSHASVLSVMWSVELGSARTRGDTSALSSKFMDFVSSSLSGPKCFGWSFRNFAFKGAARRAKLGTNRQKTLRKTMNERSSVIFVGVFNPRKASVVCDAVSRRPERMTCPR